jgi:hypothetical protein
MPYSKGMTRKAATNLEMLETTESAALRPSRQRPSLVNRNGLLVHRGKLPNEFDWSRLIEGERDERIRQLAGE